MRNLQISTRVTPRDSRSIENYLHDISQIPLLTADEEVELARKIHNGDEQALERLVTGNLRFVVSVAKNYLNRGLDFPDLVSSGNIGLITAAKRFDETRGIKFCSYAVWWIRQSILQALAKEGRAVTLPANKLALLSKFSKTHSRLEQVLQRSPDRTEITNILREDDTMVSWLLSTAERPFSLDAPLQNDEDITRIDTIADTTSAKTDDGLIQESLHCEIENVLTILPQNERSILRMSFGIGHPHPYSMGEIATHLRLSQDRVRQLYAKALRRLRQSTNKERLRGYL